MDLERLGIAVTAPAGTRLEDTRGGSGWRRKHPLGAIWEGQDGDNGATLENEEDCSVVGEGALWMSSTS